MIAGPNRFAGKNVVITGAAGDIGSATARQLASEGARVALLDRDAARLHDVAEAIKKSGGVATTHSVDVTDEASVARVLGAAAAAGSGVIDCLFNNVGISGPVGPVTTLDLGEVEHALRVNVVGMLAVLKHCVPLMRRGGAIVQTGSTASLRGAPSMAAYIASKHAVLGLSQTAAKELAEFGIRVSTICPGPIEGRLINEINQRRSDADRAALQSPLGVLDNGRYGTVTEIAECVCFLLSDAASFVTGTAFVADGGRLA